MPTLLRKPRPRTRVPRAAPAVPFFDDGDTKPFVPGTIGWTVADLDDPAYADDFERGRYEICDGVLTRMPAALFDSGQALFNLCAELRGHLVQEGEASPAISFEADLVLKTLRVPRVDAMYLNPAQVLAQSQSRKPGRGKRDRRVRLGRIVVVPTLVIESLSLGKEAHDRVVKFGWYEQAGVPNYWMLDAYRKTLECFALSADGEYELDASGRNRGVVRPRAFAPLTIELGRLWAGA